MLENLYKHCVVFIVYINLAHCIIPFLQKDIPTTFSPLGGLCPHKKKSLLSLKKSQEQVSLNKEVLQPSEV